MKYDNISGAAAGAGAYKSVAVDFLDEIGRLQEENARLLAAVVEMQKMLPVLEDLYNKGMWNVTINNYRLALETALAKRNEP